MTPALGRCRFALCAAIVAFCFGPGRPSFAPAAGAQSVLEGIHHTLASDRTRVVLDLSPLALYEIRSHTGPDRIAVNLRGVAVGKSVRGAEISSGIVRRIRVNRLSWGAQVVFDLRRPAQWSDLHLDPVDDMPGRIMVDLLERGSAGEISRIEGGSAEPAAKRSPAATTGAVPSAAAPLEEPRSGWRTFVVAVDAGHGGKDCGAKGRQGLIEKDVVFEIARRVADSLNRTQGFKAVLIREGDYYLDLVDRTRLAKKKDADVFVSIHLNSAPRRSARGMEVWFISPAGADAAAKRLLSRGEAAAAQELGIDEPQTSDILQMLVDVNQQAMMQKSFLLAEEILKAAHRPGLPPVRSVKQQSFAVLKSIDMPSVLVEAAFLTNAEDAKLMRTDKGRQAVSEAVVSGIISFFRKYPPPPQARGAVARRVHQVRKGETLWAISRKYNTSVASIRSANDLRDSDVLLVGQKLVIR